jgi:hypothetical protein
MHRPPRAWLPAGAVGKPALPRALQRAGHRLPWAAWQEEFRFEKGQPGRHHKIVGRQVEALFPRRLHEQQILVGQVEDGDLRKIDLALARQGEEQVKRSPESIKVDDERVGLGVLGGFKPHVFLEVLAHLNSSLRTRPRSACDLAQAFPLGSTWRGQRARIRREACPDSH